MDKFCPPHFSKIETAIISDFQQWLPKFVVVTRLVTTSYRNMESTDKSYPLIFGIVVRVVLTRTMSCC